MCVTHLDACAQDISQSEGSCGPCVATGEWVAESPSWGRKEPVIGGLWVKPGFCSLAHPPLTHPTSLAKHKLQDKIIKKFKTAGHKGALDCCMCAPGWCLGCISESCPCSQGAPRPPGLSATEPSLGGSSVNLGVPPPPPRELLSTYNPVREWFCFMAFLF